MVRSIRTLLVWLLVLAVPAQAVAAVTMVSCGQAHHAAATTAAHAHHDTQVDADHSAVDEAAAPTQGTHAKVKTCSACAACCSMGALPSTVLALPAADIAPAVFSVVVPGVVRFVVDGPDRPPRNASA